MWQNMPEQPRHARSRFTLQTLHKLGYGKRQCIRQFCYLESNQFCYSKIVAPCAHGRGVHHHLLCPFCPQSSESWFALNLISLWYMPLVFELPDFSKAGETGLNSHYVHRMRVRRRLLTDSSPNNTTLCTRVTRLTGHFSIVRTKKCLSVWLYLAEGSRGTDHDDNSSFMRRVLMTGFIATSRNLMLQPFDISLFRQLQTLFGVVLFTMPRCPKNS